MCGKDDTYSLAPAGVIISDSRDVTFTNCTFSKIGGSGLSISGGSKNVAVRSSTFTDISAAGIVLGEVNDVFDKNVENWNENLMIEVSGATSTHSIASQKRNTLTSSLCLQDNVLINFPVEYKGQSQLFAGYVENATINHNLFQNATYSAITIGWGWGREASLRGNNKVNANKIVDILSDRCCDGGAIYTIGPQVGSEIKNNYILQNSTAAYPAGGNALYHDRGSGGFQDISNVIDGNWTHWFGTNPSAGLYGPGASCPNLDGEGGEHDCDIVIAKNYVHTAAGHDNPANNSTRIFDNDIMVIDGSPFVGDAKAIVDAAGPRV